MAWPEFIYCPKVIEPSAACMIFISDTATAAPKSSKTMDTVVEVGNPWALKRSNKRISVSITAIKIVMSSGMVKN